MSKEAVYTDNAPKAIGVYSQAITIKDTVYISGQIGIDPHTQELMQDFDSQLKQTFANLSAVVLAASGDFAKIVKLSIYLTSMDNFSQVNEIMSKYFTTPYPARIVVGVQALPKGALVEIDAIMVL